MLKDRLPKILYNSLQDASGLAEEYHRQWEELPQVHEHYKKLADKILSEIPKITPQFLIDLYLRLEHPELVAKAINERIRE